MTLREFGAMFNAATKQITRLMKESEADRPPIAITIEISKGWDSWVARADEFVPDDEEGAEPARQGDGGTPVSELPQGGPTDAVPTEPSSSPGTGPVPPEVQEQIDKRKKILNQR